MRKKLIHIAFIIIVACQFNCKKGVFGNEGNMVTTVRQASGFGQIILSDNIDLILTQDSVEKITVEAPKKIEPYIITAIDGHALTIRNDNASSLIPPNEKIKVYVSVRDLGRFDYLGSGTVSCTNTLQKDYFSIIASQGSGNVHLKLNTLFTSAYLYSDMADFIFEGQADSCYTYCSSAGTINYLNFAVKKLQLDYSGIRDASVWATETFNGRIFYKGNVYYKGTPFFSRKETAGEGRFIQY